MNMTRKKSHLLEVQQDEYGDYFIEFPSEVIDELGWKEGDILEWNVQDSGEVLLTKSDE